MPNPDFDSVQSRTKYFDSIHSRTNYWRINRHSRQLMILLYIYNYISKVYTVLTKLIDILYSTPSEYIVHTTQ